MVYAQVEKLLNWMVDEEHNLQQDENSFYTLGHFVIRSVMNFKQKGCVDSGLCVYVDCWLDTETVGEQ